MVMNRALGGTHIWPVKPSKRGVSLGPKRVFPEGFRHTQRKTQGRRYDGCEFSPSCLNCPLPKCRYDMTVAERRQYALKKMAQDHEVV